MFGRRNRMVRQRRDVKKSGLKITHYTDKRKEKEEKLRQGSH